MSRDARDGTDRRRGEGGGRAADGDGAPPGGAEPADRTLRRPADLDALDFRKGDGLVPVVAQDADAGEVLMVAWADREALEATLETGWMHFRSRSRQALWKKGETSGNRLRLRSLHADCDGDTVLALVAPEGPACHTDDRTCFGETGVAGTTGGRELLDELWSVLESRARERPAGSYTVGLLDDENLRLKKLGEELSELTVALARGKDDRIPAEAADLVYHLLVALLGAGVGLDALLDELEARREG